MPDDDAWVDDAPTDEAYGPTIDEMLGRWSEIRTLMVEFDGYPPDDSPAIPRWQTLHRQALADDYPTLIFYLTYRKDIMERLETLAEFINTLTEAYIHTTDTVMALGREIETLTERVELTFPSDDQLTRHGFHPKED